MRLRFLPAIVALLGTIACATEPERAAPPATAEISSALRTRLQAPPSPEEGRAPVPALLRAFYAARGNAPLWIGPGGPNGRGEELLAAIRTAPEEGLRAEEYGIARIEAEAARLADAESPEKRAYRLADLEVRLSQAYLSYGSDLSRGRVEPERVAAQWSIARPAPDGEGLLRDAAAGEKIETILERRLPRLPVYAALRGELARYRALPAAGWPIVPRNVKLRQGDRGEAVAILRERLAAEGYLERGSGESSDRFDASLDKALRAYQARNGLDADGVAGRDTIAALDVPAPERVNQIALNMERLRWLPRSMGERFIFVDVPGFRLLVFEDSRVTFSSPVIVGREDRPTPVFSATMNHVVFNPYWRVPRSIALKDKLAEIRQDPAYFEEHHIEVFRYESGGGTTQIDPATVDWSTVTKNNFGYLFRQKPGDDNALGRVKFMFPNPYSVYIHDTPSRYLFRRSKRTFSSGCIRVEKPLDLGAYLMAGNPGWDRARFAAAIEAGKTRTVRLQRRLPVYVVYLTAWADAGGQVGFRRDIYGRDRALALALKGGQPPVQPVAAPLPEAGP